MARNITVTFEDGSTHVYENAPDNVTPEAVSQRAQKDFGKSVTHLDGGRDATPKTVEPMGLLDKALSRIKIPDSVNSAIDRVRGVAMGAADPSIGAIQLGANVTGIGKDAVNNAVSQKNAEYEKTREMGGREGFDAYRFAGNVASPVNAVPAGYLARANSLKNLAARGAAVGAGMGAIQPVASTDNFAQEKAIQTGVGAATGAVATPAISLVASGLSNAVNGLVRQFKAKPTPQEAASLTERVLTDWANSPDAKSTGFDLSKVPASMLDSIRQRVSSALSAGKQIDPAALLREADFNAVGVKPTAGQLSRDPQQFARERDLRGIDLGGAPNGLAQRFAEQGKALRAPFSMADGADEAYGAGNKLVAALRAVDKPREQAVSAAYSGARDTTGRYANVNVKQFSEAANKALDEGMLGNFLPAESKALLNDISTGKIPLNVNNLVQVDSVLSSAQRSAGAKGDKAAQLAIGKVRDALNSADIEGTAGAEAKAAFDKARGMAKERFAEIEKNPALKAALDQEDPDRFVSKYIIGGTTNELRALTKTLESAPEGKDVVRSQVASFLKKKAFPSDTSGDGQFTPAAFNKALESMGKEKLAAVFSPEELDKLYAAGRVMSYIKTQPEGSAVNNSNTGAAVMNLLSQMSGKVGAYPGLNIIRNSVRNFQNERAVAQALKAQVPTEKAARPESLEAIIRALRAGGPALSGSMASGFGQQQ